MKFYMLQNAMCDMFTICPNGDVLYLTSDGKWTINKIYTVEEVINDPEFKKISLHVLKDLGIPVPKRDIRKLDWNCDDADTYSTCAFVEGKMDDFILFRDFSGLWHLHHRNKDPSERISSSPLRHTLVEKAQSLHEEYLYAEFFK